MKYAITDIGWRTVEDDFSREDLLPGETLVDEVPQWLIDRSREQEVVQLLNALIRRANTNVFAIQGRITTLEYLLNDQDPDDPDYVTPTAEDEAELSGLRARLRTWNSYNVKLGKVRFQAGWFDSVVWPVAPVAYVEDVASIAGPQG